MSFFDRKHNGNGSVPIGAGSNIIGKMNRFRQPMVVPLGLAFFV
jgi:prefoldin subunit 5